MKPIIRNAEEAAYILQIAPQAFREQAKTRNESVQPGGEREAEKDV